jgi:cystinosin
MLSAIIGWTYVALWTASYYPQFILNIRRKTTRGFSIDFALLNVLGLFSYAIYNVVLFFSPTVRKQYADRNPSSPIPSVQPNDVAYGLHGALITIVMYTQFYPRLWGMIRLKDNKSSIWAVALFWGGVTMTVVGVLAVVARPSSPNWMWLDVVRLCPR